jgi:hypothetical protein
MMDITSEYIYGETAMISTDDFGVQVTMQKIMMLAEDPPVWDGGKNMSLTNLTYIAPNGTTYQSLRKGDTVKKVARMNL